MREVLLEVTCAVCGNPGRSPCGPCADRLKPAPLLPPPAGVDACLALLAYEGTGRELVARLKYRNHRAVVAGLAAAMASLVPEPALLQVVTWAPTTPQRRRQRGFDQGELLSRAVSRRLALPCRRLLVRLPGTPQTGRPLAERHTGPRLTARRTPLIADRAVLVVDDVVTSGSTAAAAAHALRGAGARSVMVLAAARTPGRAPPLSAYAYTGDVAYGSVVASRCQSQAKRPT